MVWLPEFEYTYLTEKEQRLLPNIISFNKILPTCGEGNAMLLSRVRWDGNRLLQLDQPSSRSLR